MTTQEQILHEINGSELINLMLRHMRILVKTRPFEDAFQISAELAMGEILKTSENIFKNTDGWKEAKEAMLFKLYHTIRG